MRLILTFILCSLFSMGCSNDKKNADAGGWEVTIKGKVNKPQPGLITIQEIKQDGTGKKDSVKLSSTNMYEAKLHLTEPGYYRVDFFNRQVVNLMVNKSNIELNVDGNDQQGFAEIKGSPDHDLYKKVQEMMGEAQAAPELATLEGEFQKAAAEKDEKKMGELQGRYLAALEKGKSKIVEYLKTQPPSLALINLLQDPNLIDKDNNIDLYVTTLDKYKKEWPSSHFTKEFGDMVAKMKVTAIGQPAPEIALANPEGTIVKLSSLKGKYVLIDFWAKWCGPCRRENPNVVRAYHKFKDKGFEVYSVSLDRTKEDWLQAIKEDGLTWTHVSDLKYFECQAAKDYNINAIPFSILLDKNGVIIAKNLRGAALDTKLTEVLKD